MKNIIYTACTLFIMQAAIAQKTAKKTEALNVEQVKPAGDKTLLQQQALLTRVPCTGPEQNNAAVFRCHPTTTKEPVYVINGVISTSNDFQKLEPRSIESITVIKNEKAISAYGSAASEGAIVVTTKNSLFERLEEINAKQDSILNITNPIPGALQKP